MSVMTLRYRPSSQRYDRVAPLPREAGRERFAVIHGHVEAVGQTVLGGLFCRLWDRGRLRADFIRPVGADDRVDAGVDRERVQFGRFLRRRRRYRHQHRQRQTPREQPIPNVTPHWVFAAFYPAR